MTERQVVDFVVALLDDVIYYSRQLERHAALLPPEQVSAGWDSIYAEATLSALCALGPALGIAAPTEGHAQAQAVLSRLIETDFGTKKEDQ